MPAVRTRAVAAMMLGAFGAAVAAQTPDAARPAFEAASIESLEPHKDMVPVLAIDSVERPDEN